MYDGIIICGGQGNPKDNIQMIEICKNLLKSGKPVFAVGNAGLYLALAAGADTFKLPFGHRGINHPCTEEGTSRCYITTQNHGYGIREGSLPAGWKTTFINNNDNSIEGFCNESKPFSGVLFYPEGCPGSRDTEFLFDRFIRQIMETL